MISSIKNRFKFLTKKIYIYANLKVSLFNPLSANHHKMVKHTLTIRRQQPNTERNAFNENFSTVNKNNTSTPHYNVKKRNDTEQTFT